MGGDALACALMRYGWNLGVLRIIVLLEEQSSSDSEINKTSSDTCFTGSAGITL